MAIQKPLSFISEVTSDVTKASAEDVSFRDLDYFVAGKVHNHYHTWEQILYGFHKKEEVLKYISKRVSVFDFFKPFKGDFKGKSYDSQLPPRMFFENNKICNEYEDFISATILERIKNGSISIWGKQGECEPPPPHLVMPITIEPSKPRMCHDERFSNLWMDAPHLTFDRITDIPRYVESNHYQTKLDDKSGYDHFMLTEESRTYFGLCWKAWCFVFNTLPFGWSPSAYVYHTSGLGPSHFNRSNNTPLSQ